MLSKWPTVQVPQPKEQKKPEKQHFASKEALETLLQSDDEVKNIEDSGDSVVSDVEDKSDVDLSHFPVNKFS